MYTVRQRQWFTQGENVELLAQYGLFLAKIATVVVAIAVIAAIIVNLTQRKNSAASCGSPILASNIRR
jgi:serine protease SohB